MRFERGHGDESVARRVDAVGRVPASERAALSGQAVAKRRREIRNASASPTSTRQPGGAAAVAVRGVARSAPAMSAMSVRGSICPRTNPFRPICKVVPRMLRITRVADDVQMAETGSGERRTGVEAESLQSSGPLAGEEQVGGREMRGERLHPFRGLQVNALHQDARVKAATCTHGLESRSSASPAGGSILMARAPPATSRETATGPGTFCARLTISTTNPFVDDGAEVHVRRDQAAVSVPFEDRACAFRCQPAHQRACSPRAPACPRPRRVEDRRLELEAGADVVSRSMRIRDR